MNDVLTNDDVFEPEIGYEEDTDMSDALGKFDDSYFDEEFGVYEEPPYKEVFEQTRPTYRIPVPTNRIQEPVFGRFVCLRTLHENALTRDALTRDGEDTWSC